MLAERKRGRGSQNKAKVLASVSFGRDENDPKYCKLHVVERLDRATVEQALQEALEAGTAVKTDGAIFFNGLSQQGFTHHALTMEKPKDNQQWLPWLHIVISNAKRFIGGGTHHSVRYLQSYLAEYCWRFNQRHGDLFERLVNTALWLNSINVPASSQ